MYLLLVDVSEIFAEAAVETDRGESIIEKSI